MSSLIDNLHLKNTFYNTNVTYKKDNYRWHGSETSEKPT